MTDDAPRPQMDPLAVDRHELLLSGLVDGEVTTEELTELEELAIAKGTTLDVMTADFHAVRGSIAESVIDTQVPEGLRNAELSMALDEVMTPPIEQLAATRAAKRHRFSSPWLTAGRLQWAGSIAAGLLVVAGIGFIGANATRGADEDSAASSDTTASERTGVDASESVASLEMEEDPAAQNGATMAADAAGGGDSAPVLPVEAVGTEVAPADLSSRIQLTPIDQANASLDPDATAESDRYSLPLQCVADAGSIGAIDSFGIAQRAQDLLEVYVFEDGSSVVLNALDCREVDS